MTAALSFDQIRLPPECETLRREVRDFLAEEIAALPLLELICTVGVGYENVNLAAARARGIPVCNAAGTNDAAVADHAMAILLAAIRRIPFLNNGVRHGLWRDDIPRPPLVSGRDHVSARGAGHRDCWRDRDDCLRGSGVRGHVYQPRL